MNVHNLIYIIFILGCLFCCYTDFKYKKIYNKITYPLIILGLIFNIYNNSIKTSIIGILIALFIPFGGGDKKLFMALGSFLGIKPLLDILVLVLCITLPCILFEKEGFKVLKLNFYKLINIFLFSFPVKTLFNINKEGYKIKLAIPITISLFIKLLFFQQNNFTFIFLKDNYLIILMLLIVLIPIFIYTIVKTLKNLKGGDLDEII